MNRADSGDVEGARSMGRAALWVSIAGVIIAVVVAIVCIVLYYVFRRAVATAIIG